MTTMETPATRLIIPPPPLVLPKDSSDHTCATADESTVISDISDNEKTYRRVTFANTRHKYLIEPYAEYAPEEIAACWYNEEEKAKRMSRVEKIADRMEKGKMERRSYPYRGLDRWTFHGAAAFEELVFELYSAVLDEQDVQWDEGAVDLRRMAEKSFQVSAPCAELALNKAYQDELEAVSIYQASMIAGTLIFKDDDSSVGSMGSWGSMASTASSSARKSRRRAGRKKAEEKIKTVRTKRKGSRKKDRQDKKDRKDPPAEGKTDRTDPPAKSKKSKSLSLNQDPPATEEKKKKKSKKSLKSSILGGSNHSRDPPAKKETNSKETTTKETKKAPKKKKSVSKKKKQDKQ